MPHRPQLERGIQFHYPVRYKNNVNGGEINDRLKLSTVE